ncbi:hypothetical protein VFPPC_02023 [Pochonia chlamydosporia 170]|uniref:Uncharacterized protein n=1 Tax=Pochonia chlamydosporia 170 TaxID=1380566 RepID=A0A179F6C1_METCM|nr:hypothetical protein VFPPC_02023 [Pochonia chlamydosporia 170]OAQ60996.1 hypothetical protein VFPPC_02023 [Pochonia chlamydosporia 170]
MVLGIRPSLTMLLWPDTVSGDIAPAKIQVMSQGERLYWQSSRLAVVVYCFFCAVDRHRLNKSLPAFGCPAGRMTLVNGHGWILRSVSPNKLMHLAS